LPPFLSIKEDPHIPKGLASLPFDGEGVETKPRWVVENGLLQGYFLSSYTACKLGMTTTGNAGGAHNLILEADKKSFDDLVQQMHRGLIVSELMGHGVNLVTGDYSKGGGRILGRKWYHRVPGGGNYHCRQSQGDVCPYHRPRL